GILDREIAAHRLAPKITAEFAHRGFGPGFIDLPAKFREPRAFADYEPIKAQSNGIHEGPHEAQANVVEGLFDIARIGVEHDGFHHGPAHLGDDGAEQAFLAAELLIERRTRAAGAAHNVVDGRGAEPFLEEQLDPSGDEGGTAGLAAGAELM